MSIGSEPWAWNPPVGRCPAIWGAARYKIRPLFEWPTFPHVSYFNSEGRCGPGGALLNEPGCFACRRKDRS